MSDIKLNCYICGKELGLGNRVSSDGVLWKCEDCARKQREEYNNIAEERDKLKQQLAEEKEYTQQYKKECAKIQTDYYQLKQQFEEKDKLLNQYPYKNDVIEKQYEDLKHTITFLILNNIENQEQLNHSIDVLCEKHKARIRDIENGICKIEQLEKQLIEKEKENLKLKGVVDSFDKLKQYHKDAKQLIFLNPDNVYADGHKLVIEKDNQDKISFAIEKLEKVKAHLKHKGFVLKVKAPIELPTIKSQDYLNQFNIFVEDFDRIFDNQIKRLKEGK